MKNQVIETGILIMIKIKLFKSVYSATGIGNIYIFSIIGRRFISFIVWG